MRLTAKDSRSHTRRLRPAYLRRKYSLVGGGHNLAVCSPQRPTGYTNAFGGKLALETCLGLEKVTPTLPPYPRSPFC